MKKSFILLLFSSLLLGSGLQGQTAVLAETGSSCSALTVTMTGGCFGYTSIGVQNGNNWYFSSYSSKTYRITLFKKQSDGTFASVEPTFELSSGSSYSWSNLPQGDYQVSTSVYICSSGQTAYNSAGQLLGSRVVLSPGATSNVVGVGATKISDNITNFLDANGMKIFPNANGNSSFFAPDEEVRINTAASKNYHDYFMAIFEDLPNGSPGRWRGLGNGGNGGWQSGPMPATMSLTNLWNIDNTSNWTFTPGNSYRLQVALSKGGCGSWTEVISNFYICQTGWGCRRGGEKKMDNKIVLSPNPASNKFRLDGIDFTDKKNCDVFISDVSGREIQRFRNVNTNEFALNGLSNGIYIVNITADNRRLFSNKLVVNN